MFILHVKHYFCKFLKFTPCKKDAESAFLLRLLPANYKIFEVPVSIIFVIIFISELILCTVLLTAFLLGSATSCGRFSISFLALVILLLANFLLFRRL